MERCVDKYEERHVPLRQKPPVPPKPPKEN